MKIGVTSIAALLLFVSSLFIPRTSGAYTISVSCIDNVFPMAGRPFGNIDCQYIWQAGGYVLHTHGSWSAYLEYRGQWPLGDPVDILLDQISMPIFPLSSRSSPDWIWIACANQTGTHRAGMVGNLHRFVAGGTWGPGYWATVASVSDAEFTLIEEPLVRCF